MKFLKALFENGAITWDQFVAGVEEKGYKLADLATGNYVGKKKHEDELAAKDTTITDLNTQIQNRDTDITNLRTQVEQAGNDATKISELNTTITNMQTAYETQKTEYEQRLQEQSYNFAVQDYARAQKFTSDAAKRDFTQQMISAKLKMQDNKLMGADDFLKSYKENNETAFVVEPDPNPAPQPQPGTLPTFVQPTPPQPAPGAEDLFNFSFTGVR